MVRIGVAPHGSHWSGKNGLFRKPPNCEALETSYSKHECLKCGTTTISWNNLIFVAPKPELFNLTPLFTLAYPNCT